MSYAVPASRGNADIIVHSNPPVGPWDDFVASHAAASTYHQSVWTRVVEEAFGHETCRLAAEAGGRIVGVLPLVFFDSRLFGRFTVSMPFFNEGGILAMLPQARASLLDAAIVETRRRGGASLELRHATRMLPQLASKTHKVRMLLPLAPSVDEQWRGLDRKLRNQVRKAEKEGVRITQGGPELLDAFYHVFARNMRDLGTPVYSRRFFSAVLRHRPEATRVFCAHIGGNPIAASIVVGHRDTLEVPWASSIREFNPTCANVLVYWTMLQFAIGDGFKRFDFGRSTPNEGTYHFKRQWGAESHPVAWEYWTAEGVALPDLSPHNPRYHTARAAWQRLPLRISRLVGPWIVRNIP